MTIQRHQCGTRMSRAVIHQNTAYLCGQVAEDANADITAQTHSVLARIETLLSEIGSSKDQLLSVIVYLRDMKDFQAMNEVWDAWVNEGCAPARACVEARLARNELLVEMSCTAAV